MTPRVPRPLLLISIAVLVGGIVVILVGGWRTGVSWDETYHLSRMRNYLEHGWYLLGGDLEDGRPGPWTDDAYVYGPVTMILLHGLTVLTGVEPHGQILATPEAYAVRHVGVGLIGILGVVTVGATGRLVLRSWQWGLVCAATLVAIPMWTGHSMFNVKDIPVATGYAITTLGLVYVARDLPGSPRQRLLGPGAVAAGVVLAVGTRPGIWPGIFASVVALLVLRRSRWRLAECLGGLLVAAVALMAIYPSAFTTPVTALRESALASSNYGGSPGYWWYVPLNVLATIPLGLLALGLIGAGFGLHLLRRSGWQPDARTAGVALLGVQAFTLPVLAVVRESNLYNGLRQLLFVAPAMAVLVAVGIALVLQRSSRRRLIPVLVCAAILVPALDQLRLFPYNYVWETVPGAIFAPGGEEDFWRTSVRALAPDIPRGGFVVCTPMLNAAGQMMRFSHESHNDCSDDEIGPLAAYGEERSGSWGPTPTDFLAVVTTTDDLGSNCTKLHEVNRPTRWGLQSMSYVARCDLVVNRWPIDAVRFGSDGSGASMSLGGWTSNMTLPGVAIRGDVGTLGGELSQPLQGRDLDVDIHATTQFSLTVNGRAVAVRPTGGDGFRAVVPASLASSYGKGRVVLAFSHAPDLRLLSVRVSS